MLLGAVIILYFEASNATGLKSPFQIEDIPANREFYIQTLGSVCGAFVMLMYSYSVMNGRR